MNNNLELFKKKEKIFTDLLEYVNKAEFVYTEEDVLKFEGYVKNLNVYINAVNRIQQQINELDISEINADREVCAIEGNCKKLAKEVYDIDKEINEKMKMLSKEIYEQLLSTKNEIKFFNYNNNVDIISESYSSFDVKQ